ncbi:hypothetical protein BDR04DRAFT_1122343 [Suillus decipiens]|nr:hypothetical protein BDR04DRAFT_1122343 [Suillus decipiens]
MNHLVLPVGVSPYIIVPYRCTESYDGGDFLTYPERKGWAKDIESNDFSRRSPSETNAFFQTWLFFGCLTEVLKAGGVKVDTNDFIDMKSNTVITQKLQQLIAQWKSLWPTSNDVSEGCRCRSYQIYVPDERCSHKRCWQSVVRDRNSVALRTTLVILRTVSRFIDLGGTEGNDLAVGEDHSVAPVILLDPEIALSISALGSALHQASQRVYESPPGHLLWKGTAIMKERLQRANWCPSRIAGTMASLGIEGRYYCAANPAKEAVLGIDPAPFLSIKGLPDQVIDRRMELFLHYIQEFHRGIIFNSLPRLKRDGYRWAPRSLLGHAVGDMGTQYTLADVKHPAYKALLYEGRHGVEGLVVQQYSATSHPTTVVVGDGDARYRVQLLLDESSDFSGWNPAAKYSLVFSEMPGTAMNMPQQEHPVLVDVESPGIRRIGTMAVLGTRVDHVDDIPMVIRIRYACRAWVTIVEEDQRFDVKGKVLPENISFITEIKFISKLRKTINQKDAGV